MHRSGIEAVVFDAYGTLFDVHSITALAESLVPGRGAQLSALWRTKQLEYSWLTSLMDASPGAVADFGHVTRCALRYATDALGLALAEPEQRALLAAYHDLAPFDDARPALQALAPRPRWILSNGSHAMLGPLVERSSLAAHLDGILSAEAAHAFKPSPRVYQLALDALHVAAPRIAFVSSNAWDAIGAKRFGFAVFWVNRGGGVLDRHGPAPDAALRSLAELPAQIAVLESREA